MCVHLYGCASVPVCVSVVCVCVCVYVRGKHACVSLIGPEGEVTQETAEKQDLQTLHCCQRETERQ